MVVAGLPHSQQGPLVTAHFPFGFIVSPAIFRVGGNPADAALEGAPFRLQVFTSASNFSKATSTGSANEPRPELDRSAIMSLRGTPSLPPLPDHGTTMPMEDRSDYDGVGEHPVEDRIGGEREHATSPNVTMHNLEGRGRLADHFEDRANLKQETNCNARVDRVLTVPVRCLLEVARRCGANLDLHADRRRRLCLESKRAMTASLSSSVSRSSRSRRSSSSAIHSGSRPS